MMTLGLVLTFATSWIAYQSVVWNLATGAPDEIASVLVGSKGQRTDALRAAARRLLHRDHRCRHASRAGTGVAAAMPAMASPANMLVDLGALIMLLGTVGVLVVCRLALAALLIIGPVFIVLALFEGTRGLFEGWLKSVAMFALVPLLTVVMGSGALLAISPMVAGLDQAGGAIPLRTAVIILVASIIYFTLMMLVFKVAADVTKGWRLGRGAAGCARSEPLPRAHHERALKPAAASASSVRHCLRPRASTVASIETRRRASRLQAPVAAALAGASRASACCT